MTVSPPARSVGKEAPKLDAVTSEWTHMILTVTLTGITVFVDGHAVGQYGFHIWNDEWVHERNLAYPSPAALKGTGMAPISMAGEPVYIGAYQNLQWGNSAFRGNIAGLGVHGDAVDLHTARCWFQSGETAVGTCPSPNQVAGAVWFGEFLGGQMPPGAATIGNAHLDDRFGIVVDGEGDYVMITSQPYAASGNFTVSFWFTRQGECTGATNQEYLFSQQTTAGGNPEDPSNAGVHVILGCDSSTLITVILVDSAGNRGMFDTPLTSEDGNIGGGSVQKQWMHLALVVSGTSALLYLDGIAAPPLVEDGTCYDTVGVPLEASYGCHCHPTCATCGYGMLGDSGWDGPDDCVTCANGLPVTVVYGDGTGTCEGGSDTSQFWRVAACTASSAPGSCNNAMDPTALGMPFSGFDLQSRDIILAGQNDQWEGGEQSFFGSMAAVSLFSTALNPGRIRCLYHYDAERVATCSEIRNGRNGWAGEFLGSLPMGAKLFDNAQMDGDFGLQLDGQGDFVTVPTTGWETDGTFTIAFWFSKSEECEGPEDSQYLFSTSKRPTSRPWASYGGSGVNIYLACAAADRPVSTVSGDVIRIWLVDSAGTHATMDYAMNSIRGGGLITDTWVHLAVTVSSTEISLFIDGQPANRNSIGYSISDQGGGGAWDGTTSGNDNSAVPDPSNLSPPLAGFDLEEKYSDFADYNTTFSLSSGTHVFTGSDTEADGWHGGYWTIMTADTHERVAGGRVDGQIMETRHATNFTVPNYTSPMAAVGPSCDAGYSDFSTFVVPITATAGTWYMHAGTRDWEETFWTIRAGGVDGAVLAGGPGYGCCDGDSGENITAFDVAADASAVIVITTARISGLKWALSMDASPLDDWQWDWCKTPLVLNIATHRYADEISWEIDDEVSHGLQPQSLRTIPTAAVR